MLPEDETDGKPSTFTRQRQWTENIRINIPRDAADLFDEGEVPAEPLKTLVALIVMVRPPNELVSTEVLQHGGSVRFQVFGWVATTLSLALTHERVPDASPLPDVVLDNVSYQPWGLDGSEMCLMGIVWAAFLLVLFHKHR